MTTVGTMTANRGGGGAGTIVGPKTGVIGSSSAGSTIAKDAGAGLRWSVAGDQGAVVVPGKGGATTENRTTEGPPASKPDSGTSGGSAPGSGASGGGTGGAEPPADEGSGLFLAVIVIVVIVAFIGLGMAR